VKKTLLLATILLLINSCGGGGAGDDDNDNNGDSENPTPVSGNVNGGLTGKIFTTDGWLIDVATGRSERVPGVYWDDYCYEFNPTDDPGHDFLCTTSNPEIDRNRYTTYSGTPSLIGDEYLTTVGTCRYHAGIHDRDCIEIRSLATGELVGERLIADSSIGEGAKFSRNGQYYALYRIDNEDIYATTSFTMYNKNHEEIASITMQERSDMPFDWGPSGEIVLSYNGALYLTPPYSLEGTKIFDLRDHPELTNPEPNSGQFTVNAMGSIRISSDGTKIAFSLSDLSSEESAPWVMNIDGTDFHKLAHVVDDEDWNNEDRFDSLAWSPNDKYILITEGFRWAHLSEWGSHSNFLYAIPSNSRNVELNRDAEISGQGVDDIIVIKTNYKEDDQEVGQVFGTAGVGLWWLP
jgi:hypothetical protein